MNPQNYFKPVQHLTFTSVMADKLRFMTFFESHSDGVVYCDLSDVISCDSAGLAFLIGMRRVCQKHCMTLIMEHIPENIRALALLYGVEKVLYV